MHAMSLSTEQKETIRALRAEGCTYEEIKKEVSLVISKSSLSYICKDVVLPSRYRQKVMQLNKKHLQNVRPLAVERNKQIRESYLLGLRLKNEPLKEMMTPEMLKVALAMLYLGEGSKWRSYRGMQLGSSSPEIVRLYISLLRACYNISLEKLH